MGRLCQTDGLTEEQQEILKAVRRFVDDKILPVATELEHADEYPQEIVDGLKELGIFGLMIPEEYDGLGESLLTYMLCAGRDRARVVAVMSPPGGPNSPCPGDPRAPGKEGSLGRTSRRARRSGGRTGGRRESTHRG